LGGTDFLLAKPDGGFTFAVRLSRNDLAESDEGLLPMALA
jgi:hypothetical protein